MSVTIIGGAAVEAGLFRPADADLPGNVIFRAQSADTISLDGGPAVAVPAGQACLCRAARHAELHHAGGRLVLVVLPDAVLRRMGVAPLAAGSVSTPADPALELLLAQAECLLGLKPLADPALRREEDRLSRRAPGAAEAGGSGDGRRKAPEFADIVRFIATRFPDPDLGIGEAARHYEVNPRTLQKVVQKNGTTFVELLTRRRLEAAHALLGDPAQGYRKISDIAFDCGFNDLSTFNRVFRRRFGRSPTAIRQKAGLRESA